MLHVRHIPRPVAMIAIVFACLAAIVLTLPGCEVTGDATQQLSAEAMDARAAQAEAWFASQRESAAERARALDADAQAYAEAQIPALAELAAAAAARYRFAEDAAAVAESEIQQARARGADPTAPGSGLDALGPGVVAAAETARRVAPFLPPPIGAAIEIGLYGAAALSPALAWLWRRKSAEADEVQAIADRYRAESDEHYEAALELVHGIEALKREAPAVADAITTHRAVLDAAQGQTARAIVNIAQKDWKKS